MGQIVIPATSTSVAPGGVLALTGVEPRLIFTETDAPANRKKWDIDVNAQVFALRTRTDADAAGMVFFSVDRVPGALAPIGAMHWTNGVVDVLIQEETFVVLTAGGTSLTVDTGGGGVISTTDWGYDVGTFNVATAADINMNATGSYSATAGTLLSFTSTNNLSFNTGANKNINFNGGICITKASAAGSASLRLPHGAAPGAPVNGDMWTTTAGLFVQINGVTVGPLT